MQKKHKQIIFVLSVSLVLFAVILFIDSKQPAEPTESFTNSEDGTYVTVRVVPELEPFIQVEPTSSLRIPRGQTVLINIDNQSEQKTYVWIGPCSLKLERYKDKTWVPSLTNWSGCSWCGQAREIPTPLFMSFGDREEIKWNQIVSCQESAEPTSGRFRFRFVYVQDQLECRFAVDQFKCWLEYRDKKWQSVYSNEFTIE